VGFKASLTEGRYTWRHNQVLRGLAATPKDKKTSTTTALLNTQIILLIWEGEKQQNKPSISFAGLLGTARDWKKLVLTYTKSSTFHLKSQTPTCVQIWFSDPALVPVSSLLNWWSRGRKPSMRHLKGRSCGVLLWQQRQISEVRRWECIRWKWVAVALWPSPQSGC